MDADGAIRWIGPAAGTVEFAVTDGDIYKTHFWY
jgi:hypothetical protein